MFILKSANNVNNDISVTFRKTLPESQREMKDAVHSTASDIQSQNIEISDTGASVYDGGSNDYYFWQIEEISDDVIKELL